MFSCVVLRVLRDPVSPERFFERLKECNRNDLDPPFRAQLMFSLMGWPIMACEWLPSGKTGTTEAQRHRDTNGPASPGSSASLCLCASVVKQLRRPPHPGRETGNCELRPPSLPVTAANPGFFGPQPPGNDTGGRKSAGPTGQVDRQPAVGNPGFLALLKTVVRANRQAHDPSVRRLLAAAGSRSGHAGGIDLGVGDFWFPGGVTSVGRGCFRIQRVGSRRARA